MGLFSRKKKKKEINEENKEIQQKKYNTKAPKKPKFNIEELMIKASTEPAYRADFYKQIINEELYVILLNKDMPKGDLKFSSETKLILMTIEKGKIPVFTSEQRIFDKGFLTGEVQYLKIQGMDLFGLVKNSPILLNPFSDFGKLITTEEIKKIIDGSILFENYRIRNISPNTKVQLAQPEKYPEELLNSLSLLFTNQYSVKSAFFALVRYPDVNPKPNFLIAIDAVDDFDQISNDAGFNAEQYLKPGEFIEILDIRKSGGLIEYFKTVPPFYKRGL